MAHRIVVLGYAIAAYALSLATILYGIGFIGGFLTPTRLDAAPEGPVALAVMVNVGLLAVFALQHSGMARPRFKQWLTQYIPTAAERATYVLLSSIALLLLFVLWQPIGGVVWDIESPAGRAAVYVLYAAGWVIVLATTYLIDHFDLFGLRQAWLHYRGVPYTPPAFVTPWPYRLVRHPLYVGWLTVFWATPTMTAAHLLFAAGTTVYILLAIRWEERDLVAAHPEYADYRRRVPMLVPGPRAWAADKVPAGRM